MGKPLQILLAVTCVAILAVIGYWAWQQYEAGRQAEIVADYRRQRDVCLGYVAERRPAELDILIKDCIARRLLTADDFNR